MSRETSTTARWKIADLYVLGAGVAFPEQLTVQTIACLEHSLRVYTNLPETKLTSLPGDLRTKCVSLWSLYLDGRRRVDNYSDVIARVVQGAERERPIAWLTPGHPLLFDSVSQALVEVAKTRGWSTSVVPAISSVDTLLVDVGYDPASGLFIHEATAVVRRGIAMDPTIASMLLQPGVFNSDKAHLTLDAQMPDLTPLRDHLLRFFGPDHRCAFVRSASSGESEPCVRWVAVAEIAQLAYEEFAGTTMFLPRAVRENAPS
jgi:uncharacterized protein YabN with tetrapyrrole methylase and pyrophosphatase domain